MPDDLDPFGRSVLTVDKRFHFIPDAKVIITLSRTDDKLLLQRFDIDAVLAKSSFDYLFVSSSPPAYARRGQTFQYAIQVRSKRGDVTYKLLGGPPRATVTATGRLSWEVPADHSTGEVDLLVAIADASRQEIFHAFKLPVR